MKFTLLGITLIIVLAHQSYMGAHGSCRYNEQANLPNNNINKGRWTEEEHKVFMQEYAKYDNNCMQIAKVLSTQTPAQIK